ncbi:MAG: pitrilysin family protein [Planctomycetota bacterium]|nr:pitrilysin family protein [Planctomycetota bacterium]MDA1105701.1 pitrilysin family protein [Planctomycetota bacterium]
MKHPITAIALLAFTLLASPCLAQQVEVEEFTLPNGMKFLLCPRHDQPNAIAAGWVAKVGSVNERPGITGISHFFEHMMFKGTDIIGTRNAAGDAAFRGRQKELRDRINQLIWDGQYKRARAGEIDNPWDPANDTDEIKALRAQLRTQMEEQQGRVHEERIATIKKEMAALGANEPGTAEALSSLNGELERLESDQKSRGTIVKDEFDLIYIEAGASGVNAFTSYDITFYIITIPSNKIELWCWMESDRLANSTFREFYSERDAVHEERRLRIDSTPTGVFQEQFESMFWQSSPYSWPVIGWPSDLNSYTFEEALHYFNIYYRPNNLVGVMVGDFDPADAKQQITRYFSRLERGEIDPPPVVTEEVAQRAEMRMIAQAEAQPSVTVQYHTVPFSHTDSYALDMLSQVLNGRTGRLYKSMIEGKEIASSAGAGGDNRKYAGAFSFSAEVKGDSTPEQLEQGWYAEVARLQNELVSDHELQKVRNQSAADAYRRLQNNFFLMIQLGFAENLGDWRYINEEPKRLQAVTAEDIQRVAKEYFTPENRSVAIYRRKAGTAPAAEDADLAVLPAPMQGMAKQAAQQIMGITDAEELRDALAQMEAQGAQMPPEAKPLMDYVMKKAKARLAELEGGSKE